MNSELLKALDLEKKRKAIDAMERLFRNIREGVLKEPAGSYKHFSVNKKSYPFVPARLQDVAEGMDVIERVAQAEMLPKLHFVDAGCGIGNICFFVYELYSCVGEITGLELSKKYLRWASKITQGYRINYIQENLLTFQDYGSFDIVYFYMPFIDETAQRLFEQHVLQTIRPGTFILTPLSELRKYADTKLWQNRYGVDLLHSGNFKTPLVLRKR